MNMSYCSEEPLPLVPLTTSPPSPPAQWSAQTIERYWRKSEVEEDFGVAFEVATMGGVKNEVMMQQRLFLMGLVISLQGWMWSEMEGSWWRRNWGNQYRQSVWKRFVKTKVLLSILSEVWIAVTCSCSVPCIFFSGKVCRRSNDGVLHGHLLQLKLQPLQASLKPNYYQDHLLHDDGREHQLEQG